MAKSRYEYCEAAEIRELVEKRLHKLLAHKNEDESATEFWSRVERADLLIEALALYDELAAERSEQRHTWRETKKQFDERIERERRQAEAEQVRSELLLSGLTQREAQVKLVERFQPLDGTKTRAWETPDPWEAGRLFKKKEDQQNLLELAGGGEEEYEVEGLTEAENRLNWARWRRNERQALVAARERARVLKLEQGRRRSEKPVRRKPSANGRQQKIAGSAEGKEDMVVI
jgi:hypothetical protein